MSLRQNAEPPPSTNAPQQLEISSGNPQGTDEFAEIWKKALEAFKKATGEDLEKDSSLNAINARVAATEAQDKENLKSAVGKNLGDAFFGILGIASDVASNIYPPAKVCCNAANLLYKFVQNYNSSFDVENLRNLLDGIGNGILVLFQEISEKRPRAPSSTTKIWASLETSLKTLMAYFIEICAECARLAKKSKRLKAKWKRFVKGAMAAVAQDEAVRKKKEDIGKLQQEIRDLIASETLFIALDTREDTKKMSNHVQILANDNAEKQKRALRDSSIDRIRSHLPYTEPSPGSWEQVQTSLQQSVRDSTFGTWIQTNQHFSQWAAVSQSTCHATLALKTHKRTGASYLSRRAIEKLAELQANVAWIYCKNPEGISQVSGMKKGSISIHDALTALVWQLIQDDTAYREFVSQKCERVAGIFDTKQLWNRLFMEYFLSKEPRKDPACTERSNVTTERRKVFFLVIDGLDLADGNTGNQGCKSMLRLMIRNISELRKAENHIRLLITGSTNFFEELGMHFEEKDQNLEEHLCMLDTCDDENEDIQKCLREDHVTFVRSKLDQVFSNKTSSPEIQNLRPEFEDRLVQESSHGYSELQLIFEEISRRPDENLETLLKRDQLLPERPPIEQQLKDLKLSEENAQDLTEILPWLVLKKDSGADAWDEDPRGDRGAWPTLEQLEVVLRLKHGHASKSLLERIETTYSVFLSVEDNHVEASSVKEFFLASNSPGHDHEAESPNFLNGMAYGNDEAPDPREVAVIQDLLKSFSGGKLYERFKFDEFFKHHHTKGPLGIHYTPVDGHMRIILGMLKSVCPENREDGAPLHDYAVENLLWHLGQIKDASLSRASPSMKMAIGRWLYAFFLHEGFVRVWLTPGRLATVLSNRWWKALDEVLRWFQDPAVGEGARALLGKPEGMIVLERKDLLLQASRVLASEWLENTEWDVLQALEWILRLPKELSGGFFLGSAEDSLRPSHRSENRVPLDTIIEAEKWAIAQIGKPNLELSSIRIVETMATLNYWEEIRDRCTKTLRENGRNWKARWYLAQAQVIAQRKQRQMTQHQDRYQSRTQSHAHENFYKLIRRFLDSPDLRRMEPAAWKNMWKNYWETSEELERFDEALNFSREIFFDRFLDDYPLIRDIFDRMCSNSRWSEVEGFLCRLATVPDPNNCTLLAGLLRHCADSKSENFHQNLWLSLRNGSSGILYRAYHDARTAAKSETVKLVHLRYYHALALFYDHEPESSASKDGKKADTRDVLKVSEGESSQSDHAGKELPLDSGSVLEDGDAQVQAKQEHDEGYKETGNLDQDTRSAMKMVFKNSHDYYEENDQETHEGNTQGDTDNLAENLEDDLEGDLKDNHANELKDDLGENIRDSLEGKLEDNAEDKSQDNQCKNSTQSNRNDAPEASHSFDPRKMERALAIWRKSIDQWSQFNTSFQDDLLNLIWGNMMERVGSAYVELLRSKPANLDRYLDEMRRLKDRSEWILWGEDPNFVVLLARAYHIAEKDDDAKAWVQEQLERAFELLEDETPYNDWKGYQILAETIAPLTEDDKDVLVAWHLAMRSSSEDRDQGMAISSEQRVETNDDDTDTESEDAQVGDLEREDRLAQSSRYHVVGINKFCDGLCGKSWVRRFKEDMWVCRDCADKQFDKGCMEKLKGGKLERRVCNPAHVDRFIHVKNWNDQVKEDVVNMDEEKWLKEVKDKYLMV